MDTKQPESLAQECADYATSLRSAANEWADMAINGLQWLRNIVDGTSEPKGALENMERCMVHCRSVNDAQPVQDAIRAASAAVPAAPAPVAPSDYDALRCAEGNCMFNGEVAQHAPDCTTTGVTAAPTDAELRGLWLHHAPNIGGPFSFARAVLAKWGAQSFATPHVQKTAENVHVAADVYKKAQESNMSAPAGIEPVARIEGIDEYGPRLEWFQHWVDVGVGANLFTASQVQAMLAQRVVYGESPVQQTQDPDAAAFAAWCCEMDDITAAPKGDQPAE